MSRHSAGPQSDHFFPRLSLLLLILFLVSLLFVPIANAQPTDPAAVDHELRGVDEIPDTWLIGLDRSVSPERRVDDLRSQGLEFVRVWPDFYLAEVRVADQGVRSAVTPQAVMAEMERQRQNLETLTSVRYATPNLQVFAADLEYAPTSRLSERELIERGKGGFSGYSRIKEKKSVVIRPFAPFRVLFLSLRQSSGLATTELLQDAVLPNDPLLTDQWALDRVDIFDGWNITQGSAGMAVAVIDSGYDVAHEDIAETSLWINQAELDGVPWVDDDGNGFIDDLHGWDWVENDAETNDPYGHGTHVGGTLAATTNNQLGVAGLGGNLRIMPLRVLDEHGSGQISDLVDALYYAMQADVRVVNLSLVLRYDSPALKDAISVAWQQGMLVVAAAGNANTNVYWPAAYPATIAVAATDDEDERASFSNFGDAVNVAAPGVDILGTYLANSYESQSGTSMATPHVSALVGLLWSLRPDLSTEGVVDLIQRTAVDVNAGDEPGFDPDIGHGRIDFNAALLEASSALNIDPEGEGARVALAGEPFAVVFQVMTAANGDNSALPVEGAVVHYALESTGADDESTGASGRTASDENGLATVTFLAPSIGGAYQLRVQLGAVETSIPVSIVTEPNRILVTPETTATVVGEETVKLHVSIVDSDGRPVVDELTLRLETDLGHWGDGEQIRTIMINDGVYEATFFPGEIAGIAAIRVSESYLSTAVSIDIQPGAASHIDASVGESSAVIAAGGESIDLTFFVQDRFTNPVADGTPVRLFTSGGELSASDLMTQDGQVTTTLHVPAGAISPIQVWAMVPGTHAQTELAIVVMSNQLWLPVVASGTVVD